MASSMMTVTVDASAFTKAVDDMVAQLSKLQQPEPRPSAAAVLAVGACVMAGSTRKVSRRALLGLGRFK